MAAGVAAASSGAEPAGWRPADLAWTAAFGAVVAYAGSRARRWTWVVLAGGATAFASGALWTAVGGVALALTAVAGLTDTRSRLLG
ncbi:MAG TPA: hypothetical protein VD926_08575, partial [Acidimicrobiales bacterium]|nr:hypothetical protein [Acidimicrobiales bacterium]